MGAGSVHHVSAAGRPLSRARPRPQTAAQRGAGLSSDRRAAQGASGFALSQ